MKKTLKFISKVLGWFTLWLTVSALSEGLIYTDQKELISFALLMYLPIGILFAYLGQKYTSRKTKIVKSFEIFFILLIINGVFKLPTIFMIVGVAFIAIGGIPLFIISKMKLEGEFDHESSFIR